MDRSSVSGFRARRWLLLVLLVEAVACTTRNPLYCDRDQDCASGACNLPTNTCSSADGSGGAAASDATIDATIPDALTPDGSTRLCSSTCTTCSQQNRACCGTGCCGIGEWCDKSGQFPICRCGSGQACVFNTYCCASAGQCGSQCRTFCF